MAENFPYPHFDLKSNRETYTVRVEGIAPHVNRQDITSLFSTLIGDIIKSEEHFANTARSHLEITFSNKDALKKAECMSGYTVSGQPLLVTMVQASKSDRVVSTQTKREASRRNLYVLGLPFDLTKSEFAEIFARCGTVSHCVILATVDNGSRRRGFVVMSTHEQANLAMKVLSRTEIKGHVIDVSWAVVQRSQGFLDGGDRHAMLESHLPSESPTLVSRLGDSDFSVPNGISGSEGRDCMSSGITSIVPTNLLVTNIPTLLFSQISDFHSLFLPFGRIQNLKTLEPSPLEISSGSTSVIVEYALASDAKDAKEALHGQVYADFNVKVEYLHAPPDSAPHIPLHGSLKTLNRPVLSVLNPLAPSYVHASALSGPAARFSSYNIMEHQNGGFANFNHGLTPTPGYSSQFAAPIKNYPSFPTQSSSLVPRSGSVSSRTSNDSVYGSTMYQTVYGSRF